MRDWNSNIRLGLRTLVVLAITVSSTFLAVPASSATTIHIEGHGYGHGRGMGQFGSLGYALKGWPHTQILDHFYGGTTAGNIGDIGMSVRLTVFDGKPTMVQQERGHMTTNVTGGTNYHALRATRIGTNHFRVESAWDCNGPWTHAGDVPGPIVFEPMFPGDDRGEMLQMCEPDGSRRWLRGNIRTVDDGGTQRTVNELNNESYLRGVVPRESPASWADLGEGRGINALRAQAVAARSYAASENRYWFAKTCDTESCQVYKGRAVQQGTVFRDLEDPRTDRAIAETAGVVRMKDGAASRTEFSSSTGGWTAGGKFPAVIDEGDSVSYNQNHHWKTSVSSSTIESKWPTIGTYRSITVTRRNGLGDWGGRVTEVKIDGTSGSVIESGNTVRLRLGLKSDWFLFVPGWGQLGGVINASPDAAAPGSGNLDVFARGADGALWQKHWTGSGWSGWGSLGGYITSSPAAVSWGPGRIDVFVRGGDDGLWHRAWTAGGWSAWQSLGGIIHSGPDVSSWGPGRLDVFAIGADKALWTRSFDGASWSGWSRVGGMLTSDPTAVSPSPGKIHVFGRGGDNALWRAEWNGQWSGWGSLGGILNGGPDAASRGQDHLEVFVIGADKGLWRMQWFAPGIWSAWEGVGAPLTPQGSGLVGDPTATSAGDGRMDVFARGIDDGLWHKWHTDRWHP